MNKLIKKVLLSVLLILMIELNLSVFDISLLNTDTAAYKSILLGFAYFLLVYLSLVILKELMILSVNSNKLYTYLFAATSLLSPLIIFNILNNKFGVSVSPLGLITLILIIAVVYFNFDFKIIKKEA